MVTRSFVLTPLATSKSNAAPAENIGLAISSPRLPSYLLRNSIAVRKGTNEVFYLEGSRWAEPLDSSFQRTVAANLGALLPSERIRLSSWQRDDVTVALHVTIEQFDVDDQGRGVLHAWWRISSPGAEKVYRSGETQLSRPGPSPFAEPQSIAVVLSELTAEFSRSLVTPLREAAIATAGAK
jgi:uncharacterized lipoprotein YmbA